MTPPSSKTYEELGLMKGGKLEYRTADGFVLTDDMLEAETALFDRGERPTGWEESGSVDVTPTD